MVQAKFSKGSPSQGSHLLRPLPVSQNADRGDVDSGRDSRLVSPIRPRSTALRGARVRVSIEHGAGQV